MTALTVQVREDEGLEVPPFLVPAPESEASSMPTIAEPGLETVRLCRVVGAHELALLAANDWTAVPPRRDWSVLLVKLLTEEQAFAVRASRRRWHGLSIVTMDVAIEFAAEIRVRIPDSLGGHWEHWVEVDRLHDLNANLRGPITLVG